MKYKISNAYAVINGEEIQVGVALGQEDLPESPFTTGYVTNSEYEQGLKEFRSGDKDNKCDFGPSKRPSYCSEEAADFFHRFKTCSIYLLPVQYLYRFMSET